MKTSLNAFLLFGLGLACVACGILERGRSVNPRADSSVLSPGRIPVTLAAWNVANFFDTRDDANEDTVLDQAQYQKKIQDLRLVMETLEADFLALEEVENLACLQALNGALPTPYPHLGLIEGNDTRGIDVAFLSRLPVARVVSHRDRDLPNARGVSDRYRFSRDCVQVELATDPPVTVLVNHFKSQLGGKKESAAKRRVQAQAVVDIVNEVATDRPEGFEVVMGDLNDRPDSWSLEPLTENLLDVFRGWPDDLRASHRSPHGDSALDHILISQDAEARVGRSQVWQGVGKGASDHDPVSVEIRLDLAPAKALQGRVWSEGG